MNKPKLRCAIYTRKSSEEGLEQNFNSLDAQREACEAYITSQVGEGWTLVRHRFDDGGYSGGNIDRPGLKTLLEAIDSGRIDVVVVYKVDRLTRSLSDFAKIIERFDAKKVSFVSVTQAFNTTTSMGRLTLNVLLSFAQFEREVTGERIRDKIAASKAKGMWMGGAPPLGYDPAGGTVTINEKEAETVRWIFRRYTEIRSVDALVAELAERKIKSKTRVSSRGRKTGGFPIVRGAVNHMLRNPIYLGKIRHKDKLYPGQHQAIVTQTLWDLVQKTVAKNRCERKRELTRAHSEWWLTGKLFDALGRPMSPTYTARAKGKRYKYYAVQNTQIQNSTGRETLTRISMQLMHQLVEAAYRNHAAKAGAGRMKTAREAVEKVTIERNRILIDLSSNQETFSTMQRSKRKTLVGSQLAVPIRIAKRGERSEIIAPEELGVRPPLDPRLLSTLKQAWQWRTEIEIGSYPSIDVLAEARDLSKRYVNKVISLAFITPTHAAAIALQS